MLSMNALFNFENVPPDSSRWGKFPESKQIDASTGLPKLIPLWVADMDFDVAEPIQTAMSKYLSYPRFGYATAPANLAHLICDRLSRLYEWQVDPEWLVILPGVVPGLYASTLVYTQPDQQVLFPVPIYHHLHLAAAMFGRPQRAVPQRRDTSQGRERLLLSGDDLREVCEAQSRLLLFCNPQNPGGTVYRRHELESIAAVACEKDLIVCSDEIHADLILDPTLRHIPIASLNSEIADRTVTLMSLGKTFNIAGMGLAWAVVKNPALRAALKNLQGLLPSPSGFAYQASLAALAQGEPWRQELLTQLRCYPPLIGQAISRCKGLSWLNPEATHLAWIDAREWEQLHGQSFMSALYAHGLALSPGEQFGAPGWARLNFATAQPLLQEALARLVSAAADSS
jgi:cystathionine beta-lyase